MTHPAVDQLRFARQEFERGLKGVSPDEALKRIEPMNSIGWMICHLASHEQIFYIVRATGAASPLPWLDEQAGWGAPATTPRLQAALVAWQTTIATVDPYLDSLQQKDLEAHYTVDAKQLRESVGTMIHRTIYHYWFHTGEISAIRQMLGHTKLPDFVGKFPDWAIYRPESVRSA